MNLVLNRRPSLGGITFGELSEDGARLCYTLEDEIREIEAQPVSSWKIKGVTAIPAGRYRISLEHSPRFGPGTLTVHDVPGFTGVRIHGGNTVADTEGCPLLGLRVDGNGIAPGSSRPAVVLVQQRVRAAIEAGDEVWMDVNNPVGLA